VKGQALCRVVQNCAELCRWKVKNYFYGYNKIYSLKKKSMLMLINSLFFLFVSKKKERNKKLRVLQFSIYL